MPEQIAAMVTERKRPAGSEKGFILALTFPVPPSPTSTSLNWGMFCAASAMLTVCCSEKFRGDHGTARSNCRDGEADVVKKGFKRLKALMVTVKCIRRLLW
jgi:hypothetical protein